MRLLTLRRITANPIIIHPPKLCCLGDAMAEESKKTHPDDESSTWNKPEAVNQPEKTSRPIPPPPPEKPLPGDCCGSGCVRCVWDVYYDELEAYNKLYNSDSGSKSIPKP